MVYVSSFREGSGDEKALLGGKGAGLAEMTHLGLRVPPGFTITTAACRAYLRSDGLPPAGLTVEVDQALAELEREHGRILGDPSDPLLLSVRSGAPFSMPGMMDTVLNLGLNTETVKGLVEHTGDPHFAYDAYRRFLEMFGSVVLDVPARRAAPLARRRAVRARGHDRRGARRRRAPRPRAGVPAGHPRHDRGGRPGGPTPPARARDRGRVPLLERPAGA